MPIYEFKCTDCGNKFEALCSFSKIDSMECTSCKSKNVSKLMSTFGFRSSGGDSSGGGKSSCASCSSGNCASCH